MNSIQTYDVLRNAIHAQLCAKENLLADLFPLAESVLQMGGRPCGMQFHLHGPRNVTLSAIWVADRKTVYLYDARGERYEKLELSHHIPLPDQLKAG